MLSNNIKGPTYGEHPVLPLRADAVKEYKDSLTGPDLFKNDIHAK
ncbi:hypothetical protein [Lacticaseibacillus paracasei]